MRPLVRPLTCALRSSTHVGVGLRTGLTRPLHLDETFKRPTKWLLLRPIDFGRGYSSQIPPKPSPENTEQQLDSGEKIETQAQTGEVPPSSTQASTPELPSAADKRRSSLNHKFSNWMDTVQTRVLHASQTLNDITGYSGIETIKVENEKVEVALADAHTRVRTARLTYKTSNTKRANTQREVTTLLARKDSWSPTDLERFTELYRVDHILEGEVHTAQTTLTEAEADEQSLSQRLNAGILRRYHEEQIWSDRIRRASTWGTWGLMGMNFLLFVVFQFVAEPWRRRRLVKGVVAEEKAVLEEVRGELEAMKSALERRIEPSLPLLEDAVEIPSSTTSPAVTAAVEKIISDEYVKPVAVWEDLLWPPERWRILAEDLFSERMISFQLKDATLLAIRSAAIGATLAGGVVLICTRL